MSSESTPQPLGTSTALSVKWGDYTQVAHATRPDEPPGAGVLVRTGQETARGSADRPRQGVWAGAARRPRRPRAFVTAAVTPPPHLLSSPVSRTSLQVGRAPVTSPPDSPAIGHQRGSEISLGEMPAQDVGLGVPQPPPPRELSASWLFAVFVCFDRAPT